VQRDPAKEGVNATTYARNNPLAFIDPRGLWCVPTAIWHYSIWHQLATGNWSAWTIGVTFLENPVYGIPPVVIQAPYNIVNCRYERYRILYGYWEKFWLTTYLCRDHCRTYTKTVASGYKQVKGTKKETDVRYRSFAGWFDEYGAVDLCREHVPQY